MSQPSAPPRAFGRGTVGRDAAWWLLYATEMRLATLGVTIAIARLSGPLGSGTIGVALQVTALGTLIAAFNLPQSLARHLAASEDPGRRRHLLRTSGSMLFVLSAVSGATLWAISGWLGERVYRDPTLTPVLRWCGPLVVATALTLWVEGALQGLRRFSSLTRWGACLSVLDVILGVIAAFFGVVVVVASRTLIRTVAVVAAVARWFRTRPGEASQTSEEFAAAATPLLGFAWPTMLSAAIVLAAQALLRMLLVRGSGLEAAGQYQAAESIAQGLLLIPGAASVAFMRSVASSEASGYAGLSVSLRRGLERMAGYNLSLSLVLIGVVRWTLPLLFGHRFEDARPVLVLLAAGYGLAGPCAVFGAAMLGRGEVWKGVLVNLLWAGVVLTMFDLALGSFGARGAAVAVTVGYLGLLGACIALVAPRWSVPVQGLLPSTLVSVASLAAACVLALSPGVPAPVTTVVCFAVAGAVFLRWGWPSLSLPAPEAARS